MSHVKTAHRVCLVGIVVEKLGSDNAVANVVNTLHVGVQVDVDAALDELEDTAANGREILEEGLDQ
jgi:hypothetical protein